MSATIVFDKWDELDPARMLAKLNEAFALDPPLDQYCLLDPARLRAKLESALDTSISEDAMLDVSRFIAEINVLAGNVDEGSGGDVPEWVPENAKIYIDLVNVRAWTEANGEVAIDTLLGSDANTENGWNTTSYDAGNLTADGYVADGIANVALIGTALSSILAGATITVRLKKLTTGTGTGVSFAVVSADGNHAVEVDLDGTHLGSLSWDGPASETSAVPQNQGVIGAINGLAVTYTSERLETAANGGSVLDADLTAPEVSGLAASLVSFGDVLQSITIYDPLPSTEGLSALSQTGVVNTAPTYVGSFTAMTGATVDNIGNQGWVAPFNEEITPTTLRAAFADPEGNPLTITLGPSSNPLFAIDGIDGVYTGNLNGNYLAFDTTDLIAGDYHLFLRATDPGGLYVEQEFTITVTA